MEIMQVIKDQIENNDILLYMKGSPNQPQCGFSARTVQAVMECGQKFAYVDVLSNQDIRSNLPTYANWPTFPQLWVKGELVRKEQDDSSLE
ncbi:MAG: Grx4 family monothiol glutaredoxin, partial [Thalassolituus sp.]